MSRPLSVALVLALFVAVPAAAGGAELPLGPRSLDERRSTSRLADAVTWTRIVRSGGPWRVNVLRVGPDARVLAVPAGEVGERSRPSSLAHSSRALAAVNGGYFAADGNPAGVLAAGGALLSEPVRSRTALLLGSERSFTALSFAGVASVGEARRLLDGVNRRPGLIPACGGRGGDRPTERPDAATVCTDPSEIVAFTPAWGARTPSGGTQVVVRDGAVTAVRGPAGSAIPPRGLVLVGSGAGARFLDRAAYVGAPAGVDLALLGPDSAAAGDAPDGIVGGGPRLLARGLIRVRAAAEGFAPLSAPAFYGSFVAARHPRTLAGIRADGTLLLVTVDGRRPGWSAGVTLLEAARVMRSLGAREALNLDGGGSSAMTVRERVVSRPSDSTGERPVSDSLVVLP